MLEFFTANGLFSLETLPNAIALFLVLIVVPYAIGYFAQKKGYSFWLFFLTSFVSLFAAFVIMLFLPKRSEFEIIDAEKGLDHDKNTTSGS